MALINYRYNIFIVENLTPPVEKTIETCWRRCAYEWVFKKQNNNRSVAGRAFVGTIHEFVSKRRGPGRACSIDVIYNDKVAAARDTRISYLYIYVILFNYCRKYCAYNIQNADGIY